MTEDEAKEKWCPFARVVETSNDGTTRARNRVLRVDGDENALVFPLAGSSCIGSACMAWRHQTDISTETIRSSQRPAGEGWLAGRGYDDWTRQHAVDVGGHCGLADAQ